MLQENISIHNHKDLAHSEALRLGDFIYLSGILPVDENNEVKTDSIEAEIHQEIVNLGTLLKKCGLTYSHVMKLGIQLTDLNDLPIVNNALKQVFTEPFPACTVTGAAALCHHAHVQIDGIAVDTRALEVLCACDDSDEECDGKCCSVRH